MTRALQLDVLWFWGLGSISMGGGWNSGGWELMGVECAFLLELFFPSSFLLVIIFIGKLKCPFLWQSFPSFH